MLVRAHSSSSQTDFDIESSSDFSTQDTLAYRVTDLDISYVFWDSGTSQYQETGAWDSRTLSMCGNPCADPIVIASSEDDGKLPLFAEITIRVVDQETLDRNNGFSPDIERKEFRTIVQFGQKSYANE